MESDWRFNVWLYGLDGAVWQHVARFVDFPGTLWCHRRHPFAKLWATMFINPTYGELPIFGESGVYLGPLNFPFGYSVFPD